MAVTNNVSAMVTNTVNILRDNLHDRYDSGFPVLKELIQNANDAGASELYISKSEGLSSASHPLLKKPALLVFNNGTVKDDDLRGIISVAQGGKTGKPGVIGKFGLGMKSIFHFCDMFFYVAFINGKIEAKLVNPFIDLTLGQDPFHKDWNQLSDDDLKFIINSSVEKVGKQKDGLLLWIPLRDTSYNYKILSDIYEIEDIWKQNSNDLRKNVALSLAALEISTPCNEGKRTLEKITIETQTPQINLNYPRRSDVIYSDKQKYCTVTNSDTISNKQGSDLLQKLIDKDKFTKIFSINEKGEYKEKAAYDSKQSVSMAVVKIVESENKSLNFNWCSYLPLGSNADTQNYFSSLDGEYHVLIHANFAIDSGRRGIVDYSKAVDITKKIDLDIVDDDKSSQSMWNMILIRYFIFPALLEFICKTKLSNAFVESIIQKLCEKYSYIGFFCFDKGFIYKNKDSWTFKSTNGIEQSGLSLLQEVNAYYSDFKKNTDDTFYDSAVTICNYIQDINNSLDDTEKYSLNWCIAKSVKGLFDSDIMEASKKCASKGYPFLFLPASKKDLELSQYKISDINPVIKFLLEYENTKDNKAALLFSSLCDNNTIEKELCRQIYGNQDIRQFIPLFELTKLTPGEAKDPVVYETYDHVLNYSRDHILFHSYGNDRRKDIYLHKYQSLCPGDIYLISNPVSRNQLFLQELNDNSRYTHASEESGIAVLNDQSLAAVLYSMSFHLDKLRLSDKEACNDIIHDFSKMTEDEIKENRSIARAILAGKKVPDDVYIYALSVSQSDIEKAEFYQHILGKYTENEYNGRFIPVGIDFPNSLVEKLNIKEVTLSNLENILSFNSLNLLKISDEEKDKLAEYIANSDIYKKLAISKTINGEYVALDSSSYCYLESEDKHVRFPDNYELPEKIKIIKRNDKIPVQKTKIIPELKASDVVNIILVDENNGLGKLNSIVLSNWILEFLIDTKIENSEISVPARKTRWIPGNDNKFYALDEIIDNKDFNEQLINYCENIISSSKIQDDYKRIDYCFLKDKDSIAISLLSHNKKTGDVIWPWFNLKESRAYNNAEDKTIFYGLFEKIDEPALKILYNIYKKPETVCEKLLAISHEQFIVDKDYINKKRIGLINLIGKNVVLQEKCNESMFEFLLEAFEDLTPDYTKELVEVEDICLPNEEFKWQKISQLVNFEKEIPDLKIENKLHHSFDSYFEKRNHREGGDDNSCVMNSVDFIDRIDKCQCRKMWGVFFYTIATAEMRLKLTNYPDLMENDIYLQLKNMKIRQFKETKIVLYKTEGNYCLSLTGKQIELKAANDITTVFYNDPKIDNDTIVVQLFDNFPLFSEQSIENAIKQLFELTGITNVSEDFFIKLAHPTQAEITEATNMIFTNIFSTLKELRLQEVAGRYNLIAEENYKYREACGREDTEGMLSCVHNIRNMIIEDSGHIQLDIRKKVVEFIKNAEYQERCILFELFQNADDAYQQRRYRDDFIPYLKIRTLPDKMEIIHEGRPINQYQVGGQRQYKEDLVNMLRIGWSDKTTIIGSIQTGKFGYGFKTVYLISDEPEVHSGVYNFKIKAALYPEQLEGKFDYTDTTTISLNYNSRGYECRDEIIRVFKNVAKYQVLFSKKIKIIDIGGESFSWNPERIRNTTKCIIEENNDFVLIKSDTQKDGNIDRCSFAFRKENNRIVPFDEEAPKVWCMAPLRDFETIGFAVNAEFKTNTGRQTLAIDNPDNITLINNISDILAQAIDEMFDMPEYETLIPSLINVMLDAGTQKTKKRFAPFSDKVLAVAVKHGMLPDGTDKLFYFEGKQLVSLSSTYFSDKISKQYEVINELNGYLEKCGETGFKAITQIVATMLPESKSFSSKLVKVIDVLDWVLNKNCQDIEKQKLLLTELTKTGLYKVIMDKEEKLSLCKVLDSNEELKFITSIFHVSEQYGEAKHILESMFTPNRDISEKYAQQQAADSDDEVDDMPVEPQNKYCSFQSVYEQWCDAFENKSWKEKVDSYYREKLYPALLDTNTLAKDLYEVTPVDGEMPEAWTVFILLSMTQSLTAWGHTDVTNKESINWLYNNELIQKFSSGMELQLLYDDYLELASTDEKNLRHFEALLRVYKIRKEFTKFYTLLVQLPKKKNLDDIRQFLVTEEDPELSGKAMRTFSNSRSLKLGISLIIRDLLRTGFWNECGYSDKETEQLKQFAYMPRKNICENVGLTNDVSSQLIYQEIIRQIEGKPHAEEFLNSFDLPFTFYGKVQQ